MIAELKNFISPIMKLDAAAEKDFEAALHFKRLGKKEFFLKQDQICRQLGFITKGYVRLFYIQNGEEITKDFNFENAICGSYASFSLQQPSRFNIVAMEDLETYTIGRADLYRLYDKHPAIEKLGRLRIEQMFIRKELREASFLLDTAEQRYAELLKHDEQIVQRVPLKYLASYLGIKAETLSRIRNNRKKA